jgi:hypothetical protein
MAQNTATGLQRMWLSLLVNKLQEGNALKMMMNDPAI